MGVIHDEKAYGLTIRESANDGSDFTNPAADYRRLFLGEDGQLHVKDSAGSVTDIGAGSGSVATDAIWDAAGDLAVGTGANTAAKLTKGADGTLLGVSAGALAYVGGPLCYAGGPITSPVTMTNSATWYDSGASVTIPAGTYLLFGTIVFRIANAGATHVMARLIDTEGSPNEYSGAIKGELGNAGQELSVALAPVVVTIAGTRTIKLQGQDGARASSVIVDTPTGIVPTTDKNTGFVALRVVAG